MATRFVRAQTMANNLFLITLLPPSRTPQANNLIYCQEVLKIWRILLFTRPDHS